MIQFAPDRQISRFPDWVPVATRHYIFHTEAGCSIRSLARIAGCHASTIMRQVRKVESRRDDQLVDAALVHLAASFSKSNSAKSIEPKDTTSMSKHLRFSATTPDDTSVEREGRRILRRLCEPAACLAVAKDMEKAVVVREAGDGRTVRTAVVDRVIVQAMALKEWIVCENPARISRYHITGAGRAALKCLLADNDSARTGFAEAPAGFAGRSLAAGQDVAGVGAGAGQGASRPLRYTGAESPVSVVARRKDKDGQPFLSSELVSAAERLREDFEVAQMGPRATQNWDRFLSGDPADVPADGDIGAGAAGARKRVSEALRTLGPGLGDVVLRVCCNLEGLEAAERRMGWSARSGKIVLRIALQRLRLHYEDDADGAMIG